MFMLGFQCPVNAIVTIGWKIISFRHCTKNLIVIYVPESLGMITPQKVFGNDVFSFLCYSCLSGKNE